MYPTKMQTLSYQQAVYKTRITKSSLCLICGSIQKIKIKHYFMRKITDFKEISITVFSNMFFEGVGVGGDTLILKVCQGTHIFLDLAHFATIT